MAPPRLSGKDWPRIRHDYEQTDKPLHEICEEHGIARETLRNRVRQWKWTPRRPPVPVEGPALPALDAPMPAAAPPVAPVDAGQIALGLQNATARVLAAIEATLASLSAAAHPREIERAGRTVAALTRTLHELNALKAQSPAFDPAKDRGPKDNGAFIQELIRRMDAFAARRAAERGEEASGGAALRSI
jgi:transposase-like protein